MKNDNKSQMQDVRRIGILLADLGNVNVLALKFLILRINMLQNIFEYEFLEVDSHDPFIKMLKNKASVSIDNVESDAPNFIVRFRKFILEQKEEFGAREHLPENFILITTANLLENYYSIEVENMDILALGNWKSEMAPPSIVEFILPLIIAGSIAFMDKWFQEAVHIGTKGCLFDFTPTINDARFRVLNGFICSYCRVNLKVHGYGELLKELSPVLDKKWLGKSTEPHSPAGICSNLGCELFITKGLKPGLWENFLIFIQQESVKSFLVIITSIITAALILQWGLK